VDSRDLYGLPLERFTEERNEHAKRLRQEGRREQAAEVAKLRKPSLAAWAVNQLVRTQRRDVDALLRAGDALQTAQADVLGGRGDAGALRQALDAERAALDRLTAKARGLLSAEGHELAPAKLEQVSETLHAAAIDEPARAQVRAGSLVRELRHVGLGTLGETTASGPRRAARRPPKDELGARLNAARQAETAARRGLERAERTARAAQERRDRAAAQLDEAERALSAVRESVDVARREHQRAQRAQRALEER
jgi:hypothetical protein